MIGQSRRLSCVRVKVNGLHHWPGAPAQTAYLAHPHHHLFDIVVRVVESDGDRAVEFHELRTLVLDALSVLYPEAFGRPDLLDFGERSCETIACELADRCSIYDLYVASVEIWEDDGHGTVVEFA